MPHDKLSMRKIRDVLRYRHNTELSLDAIARALNVSRGVLAKYVKLAGEAKLGWPLPDELDDAALFAKGLGSKGKVIQERSQKRLFIWG